MVVVTRRVRSSAGLAIVLCLHAALLYLLLLDRPPAPQSAAVRYSRLLLIVPAPIKAAVEAPEAPRVTAAKIRPEKRVVADKPVDSESPPSPIESPPASAPADSVAEPPRLDIDSLVKQAGKADRETRSAREVQAYGPAADSMEAVMTRAFTAAKLAVPPKWYEAARIELFSAPNDPKKIYQVKTAFGTYCLFYPDKNAEQSGGAAFGQPRVSSCPRLFGRGAR